MSAPTQRAFGRSLADFTPLKPAEKRLREACRVGTVAEIASTRPEQASNDNVVRAGFLRFLLLGGDHTTPVHEQGVRLKGAWIEDELNLENTAITSAIICYSCSFIKPIILQRSTLPMGLFLDGSMVPGIQGDGLVTTGCLHLRYGFQANGEVLLRGAQIGGDLACSGGQFNGRHDDALSADRTVIKGGVFLRNGFQASGAVRLLGAQIGGNLDCSMGQFDGKEGCSIIADKAAIRGNVFLSDDFQASGEVRLVGGKIGGNLECEKGQFNGKASDALSLDGAVINGDVFFRNGFQANGDVRLLGAQIGGHLDCSTGRFDSNSGIALHADSMRVTGAFVFRNLASLVNNVSLTAASVGALVDDTNAWGNDLNLDGLTYSSIVGGAPTTAAARLAWLDLQPPAMSGLSGTEADFRPQPWRQLQIVLREMGHVEDARQVAIAFEDRLRHADLIGVSPPHWGLGRKWLYRFFARGLHYGFRVLTGYGYRPIRLLGWFFGMWLACAVFYWFTALPPQNVFAPSNPLVFQHADYAACVPGSDAAKIEQAKPAYAVPAPVKGAGNWYLCETLRAEYTGFSPLAYSLDVILPLVDLQQEKDWAPMIPTPKAVWWEELRGTGWKHGARLVLWAETLFGWLASLLLVAIVSGLTKRRED
jgi:sRNA-binding regulator protein Hfq